MGNGTNAAWILDFLTEIVVHKHTPLSYLVAKERIIIERFKAYWPTFEGYIHLPSSDDARAYVYMRG